MIDQKLLNAAVDWWSEQITGRKLNWDNGAQNEGSEEDRKMGSMMWMMGNIVANQARQDITDEKILKFKESLLSQIKERDERDEKYFSNSTEDSKQYRSIILSVDYGPGEFLAEAARKAGIDLNVFPCKTVMWINQNKVSARLGYGAAEKIIAEL